MKIEEEIEELRSLSKEELYERLKEAQSELFNLKIGAAQGKVENPSKIRKAKKKIARVKTLLRELELKRRKS